MRGKFIVFEGLDRSGKSTQCQLLADKLQSQGTRSKFIRFPDRTSTTGQMIDSYLKQSSDLDDHAIHLLFSVNRWEKAKSIREDLEAGTTIVCDRYAFSGIAFSAAKGLDYEWCKSPDLDLPAPDLVFFLHITPEAASKRGGYGGERYETSELQEKVRGMFGKVGQDFKDCRGRWEQIDAGRTQEDVAAEIWEKTQASLGTESGEIKALWR